MAPEEVLTPLRAEPEVLVDGGVVVTGTGVSLAHVGGWRCSDVIKRSIICGHMIGRGEDDALRVAWAGKGAGEGGGVGGEVGGDGVSLGAGDGDAARGLGRDGARDGDGRRGPGEEWGRIQEWGRTQGRSQGRTQ